MYWKHIVSVCAWSALAYLCSRVDPGALQLYITVSVFVLILRNLGTRREGPSAYSVFNAGCAPLLGQLRPDQFENEMRHRPLEPQHNSDEDANLSPARTHATNTIRTARGTSGRRFMPPGQYNRIGTTTGANNHDDILARTREEILRDGRRANSTTVTGTTVDKPYFARRNTRRRR